MDLQQRIQGFNPAMETLLGYRGEDLLGQKAQKLYSESENFAKQVSITFIFSTMDGQIPYMAKYRRKDGTFFPAETTGSAIKDCKGNRIGFLFLIRDISNSKNTGNKPHRFSDIYRTLADLTYDWEILSDIDNNIIYLSPSCKRITGYTADQFLEQPSLLSG